MLFVSLMVFILSLFPAVLFGENEHKTSLTILCPDTLTDALITIKNNLNNNKWVNIDINACPRIQSELIDHIDEIAISKDFYYYLGLMNTETMRLVRNTYFATKGYAFEDEMLKKHFMTHGWYKPKEKAEIVLSIEENFRAALLKRIEENWISKGIAYYYDVQIPPQTLPKGVKIVEKGNTTLLKIGDKTTLNITSGPNSVGQGKHVYKVYGNKTRETVLVCSEGDDGQSRFAGGMDLYSAKGTLLYSSHKGYGGFVSCPFWPVQNADLLVSYNHAGCCGAIWDVFITFDSKLKPVTSLNCEEGACNGTILFSELNEGNLYLAVAARGDYSIEKFVKDLKYIRYGEQADHISETKYANTQSIWTIEQNGDMKLVVRAAETVHNKPVSSESWHVVVDSPYLIVDLMASAGQHSKKLMEGQVVTSVKYANVLILYRVDDNHRSSTTLIPVP